MTADLFGPWVERPLAIAAGRELVALAGWRDLTTAEPPPARVHVIPVALLDGKGTGWSLETSDGGAIHTLAFSGAGDDLLLGGGDGGRLYAWDTTGKQRLAELELGAPIRALAIDAAVARGESGALAIGTADGALHVIAFSIRDARPVLGPVVRRQLSDGAITAVAWDPAGLWVAGGADGQLWVVSGDSQRAVVPGGDGGIRAIACIGDGRAAIGCGDGSLRLCFIVGDVEAIDRSGDHGHTGALRGIALGPVIVDDAGREQPRRLFTAGEDGAVKAWFIDGNRRPKTVELSIGPATALVFAPGLVSRPKLDKAVGRLWVAGGKRKLAQLALGGDAELAGDVIVVGSALDQLEARLRDGSAAVKVKLAAVSALAEIAEDEARVLLDVALAGGHTEVRVAATQAMVRSGRRASRPALRAALDADPPELRGAAFHALRDLERDQPLAAVRAGLAARHEDVRVRAVEALVPLAPSSVIAAGLVADSLRDGHASVRRRAFAALREVAREPTDAVRTALARGTPDVRAEALLYMGFALRDTATAEARALAAGAFDDADQGVRTAAFLAAVMQRPALAARLVAVVPSLAQAFQQVARDTGIALALPPDPGGPDPRDATRGGVNGPALPDQRGRERPLPIDDDQLEPLFAQLACRHGDAANRGAGCLLALGDPRAIGAVLQLTREADPALRRGATGNLVLALATWPADDRLASRLWWLLDDPDAQVRGFAFDALARAAGIAPPAPAAVDDNRAAELERRLAARRRDNKQQAEPAAPAPPAAPAVTAPEPVWKLTGGVDAELDLAETALRTSQEDIRVRALQILVRVGAPGTATAEVAARADRLLSDALDDEAAKVRTEAFRTLWAWHTSEPLVPLERGARSRHGDLRGQVIAEIDRRRQAKQASAEMDRLLVGLVGDPVSAVGLAAYTALTREDDAPVAIAPEIHLAAMASPAPAVRAAGAKGAAKAKAAAVRGRLVQLIKDEHAQVHTAAIEALDAVAPTDAEGFALAFASVFYDLQVRAAELCGRRRDSRAIAPAQRILSIAKTDPNRPSDPIRQRAARALADVGDPATVAFQLGLIEDDDPLVRETAARGLATAAQPGHEGSTNALVALLGHADLPVRSWGAEGLAKLGDLRALPVLAGTQRHDHRPLRIGAIVGLVALGPDGARGLRQGLEDRDREIAELAFAVIVARDAALASAGIAPDLLVDAMSSPSPDIRFAAARLFERRALGETLDADAIGELVGPRKPDKASDMKDWPSAARRAAMLQVLADAIASDQPGLRYAATQVLVVRHQPLTFWREAARLAGPSAAPPVPLTNWSTEARTARRTGWLRRLVGERRDPEASELEQLARAFLRAGRPSAGDAASAQRLVFGVYAGLIRQAPARGASDETHRVRRDAIARLVELAREDAVGVDAVLPVLGHAVGDPHHLVRQAAMAALRALYPTGALAPLQIAIAGAADLGRAAIDELVALAADGDDRARALIKSALDADVSEVRAHAALRLARLYPAGSVEPQLLAAQSRHADVRLGAITQLASALARPDGGAGPSTTAAITDALVAALGSEHSDLRLRAAVALAKQGNPLGIDVLGGFLRSEDDSSEALEALVGLADGRRDAAGERDGAGAAAEAIAAWLDERAWSTDKADELDEPIDALRKIGHPAGAPALVRLLVEVPAGKESAVEPFAQAGHRAILEIVRDRTAKPRTLPDGRIRTRLRDELALAQLGELARSPLVSVRMRAASALGDVDARGAEDVLARLLGDRAPEVRIAAAEALALRVEYAPGATLSALEAALRGGRRELVLPAALGLAARKRPEAFQPLLLVAKAGEPPEQERALLALGSLGDRRALDHLLPLLEPAPDDPASAALTPAAVEALGRLLPALIGDEASELRARVERLAVAGFGNVRLRALTGLRYAGQIGLLESTASDPETRLDVRMHAIEQLGLAAAASSEPVLAELLSHDNQSLRQAAYRALGKVLGGDRTRISLHGLGAPHDDISRPAASYLASAGDPATLVERIASVSSGETRKLLLEGLIRRAALPRPQLEAALRSDAPVSRAAAAWIVGSAGDAGRPFAAAVESAVAVTAEQLAQGAASVAVRDVDRESYVEAEWAGLWAARRIGGAGAVAVEATAHSVLADQRADIHVRRQAAAVLATAGSTPALTALTGAVGDADREVRAIAAHAVAAARPDAAVNAVRSLGGRADAATIAPLALAGWQALAAPLFAEPATRGWSLAVALGGETIDQLIAIARSKGKDGGRLAAIAALGRLGGDRAMATLKAIHDDAKEEDAVKLAAWKALRRIARRDAKTYAEGQDKGPSGSGGGGGRAADDGGGDDDGEADELDAMIRDDEDDDDDGDGDDGDDGDGDDGDDDDGDEDEVDDDDGGDEDDDDGDDDEDEDDDD